MEESDEDMADTDGGKGNAYDEGEEDEIIESDLELEGETVEPDNDPPQQVFFSSSLNCIFYFINFFWVFRYRIDGRSNILADGRSISRGH